MIVNSGMEKGSGRGLFEGTTSQFN